MGRAAEEVFGPDVTEEQRQALERLQAAEANSPRGRLEKAAREGTTIEWPLRVLVWADTDRLSWRTNDIRVGDRLFGFWDLGHDPKGPDEDRARQMVAQVGLVFGGFEFYARGNKLSFDQRVDPSDQWLMVLSREEDEPAHPLGLPAWMARRHA